MLTAKEFFDKTFAINKRSIAFHEVISLMEEYHQAKQEEAKKEGMKKLKKEIKERNLSEFYDND